MPADFKFERSLNIAEGIHVLEFRLDAEGFRSNRAERDVGVAAHAPLFHVAVTDFEVAQNLPKRLQIGGCLLGRAQVRFTDDLEQRHAGAVEIHVAYRLKFVVDQLAGILFHVNPMNTDTPGAGFRFNFHPAVPGQRKFILGNLVALGKIGVEVVFPGELAEGGNGAVGGKRHLHGELDHLLVQDGEDPGHAQAHRDRYACWGWLRTWWNSRRKSCSRSKAEHGFPIR